MAIDGSHAFNLQWTYQSTHYDEELIIEKECRYFIEVFVSSYLGRRERFDDYLEEFQKLARLAIQYGQMGFMHRDLQSRNIMINGDRICFIDFQGGRMGPLQYDLAALLIDPYVNLDNTLQDELFDYAVAAIAKRIHIDPATFQKGFIYCRLTRNLQMLGAFGFLSQVKGKKQFEAFIPVAVQTLLGNLSIQKRQFPKLAELVTTIANLF
jgi:aminoglycoside/choline kinase family phosphotransferase